MVSAVTTFSFIPLSVFHHSQRPFRHSPTSVTSFLTSALWSIQSLQYFLIHSIVSVSSPSALRWVLSPPIHHLFFFLSLSIHSSAWPAHVSVICLSPRGRQLCTTVRRVSLVVWTFRTKQSTRPWGVGRVLLTPRLPSCNQVPPKSQSPLPTQSRLIGGSLQTLSFSPCWRLHGFPFTGSRLQTLAQALGFVTTALAALTKT